MNLSIVTVAVVLVGAPAWVAAADLESTFQSLKDAEAKGDVGQFGHINRIAFRSQLSAQC